MEKPELFWNCDTYEFHIAKDSQFYKKRIFNPFAELYDEHTEWKMYCGKWINPSNAYSRYIHMTDNPDYRVVLYPDDLCSHCVAELNSYNLPLPTHHSEEWTNFHNTFIRNSYSYKKKTIKESK